MKVFKYILFLLLIAIIGLSIFVAVQPNHFEIKRERIVDAPASVIYNNVIDFKNWNAWSPWVEKDPEMVVTLGEQTQGVGASQSWKDKDGVGSMKTTATTENASISYELQFGDFTPAEVLWTFDTISNGKTKVTWTMINNDVPFIFKSFAAFSGGFDNMMGPDFERGLEKLDDVIQTDMKAFNIKIDGITEYGGGFYMFKTTSATGTNISKLMSKQYGEIMGYMMLNNIVANGMPFTIYDEMNDENGNIIMSNAIPIINKVDVPQDSNVLCGHLPKTKVLKTTLKGNYNYLPEAWEATMAHLAAHNLEQSDLKPFEVYTNDPGEFPNPAHWVTEIYIPLKD